ncbi:coiled-coil domain-containing protein 8 [Echinops telfairi]|uniref:Coiled-coil domain-containing protein 8 n=1 Tax=Echinops telfairi TaxID=9371 RepID=A0ABM0IYB5_ECHTE|nr:coiled-coil domain-containing protein 8 [Echinops telfairi]
MLQIGDDVDHLLIPRQIWLAGGVWRVMSKPATKEVVFRERLTQFLEEEGRTLEDVARIIEKSTPHPPQPPKKPKVPQVHRRVPLMVTPPPRLVVGTYDSSNASDSDLSDFETALEKAGRRRSRGGRTRRVRRMPVSYLGSKFLGSDVESEDDEEVVQAYLRRGEKKPSAPTIRRRVGVPVPVVEDPPPPSKADRWREYASQVSWGKLKRRVKNWAPTPPPRVSEPRPAEPQPGAAVIAVQGAEIVADQGVEIVADQGAEAPAGQETPEANPASRGHKQVKTVRFQTPGRFSWFRLRKRAFWHTPRLPTLPKRVPRAAEARGLHVLRAEARAEEEQGDQEDQL